MSTWHEKRVSIIVTTYKNWRLLERSLNSIFCQDHKNIEIIVTDDGTEGFDTEYVQSLIDQNGTDHIQSVHILHSETNTGTVKNLLRGLSVMTGDYYMTFGADDMLADPKVLSTMLRYAELYKWEPLAITGQLVLCDDKMKPTGVALTEQDKAVLKSRDASLLFSTLVYRCCIATVATMYRRDFPQVVDAYDTDYCYYEDYPTFLRMARKGVTPLFIDRKISLHAGGGIANGAAHKDEAITRRFYQDRELLYRREIKPYLSEQPRMVKTLLTQRRRSLKRQFLWELYSIYDEKQRKKLILTSPWTLYWALGKGQIMRDKLTKIGVTCLALACSVRASGLFSGLVGMMIEGLCGLVAIGGISVFVCWHVFNFCVQCKEIWLKALQQ